ncbi:MAG: hypothetical protein MSD68_01360, partial [Blautia sp.]|uniref:hypothetical protein n=1 Tax=Blautia sp. TaxID=1955243 RepID=UPI0025BF762C
IGTCRGRQSYQIPAGLKYEIKSASNESVVSITKKILLCTTPSFEALTLHFDLIPQIKKLYFHHPF